MMYLRARDWGLQPSEFWSMTMSEWYAEAEMHFSRTPEGKAEANRSRWMSQLEMDDEEWWTRND